MGQSAYGIVESIRTSILKLLGEATLQVAGRGVDVGSGSGERT